MSDTSHQHTADQSTLVQQSKAEAKKLLKVALEKAGVLSVGKLSDAQEIIARIKGKASWHELIKSEVTSPVSASPAIPRNNSLWTNYAEKVRAFLGDEAVLTIDYRTLGVERNRNDTRSLETACKRLINDHNQLILLHGFPSPEARIVHNQLFRSVKAEIGIESPVYDEEDKPWVAKNPAGIFPPNWAKEQDLVQFILKNKVGTAEDLVRVLERPFGSRLDPQDSWGSLDVFQVAYLLLHAGEESTPEYGALQFLLATSLDEADVREAIAAFKPTIASERMAMLDAILAKSRYFATAVLAAAEIPQARYFDLSRLGAMNERYPELMMMARDYSGDSFLVGTSGIVADYFQEAAHSEPAVGQAVTAIIDRLRRYVRWEDFVPSSRITLYRNTGGTRNDALPDDAQEILDAVWKNHAERLIPSKQRLLDIINSGSTDVMMAMFDRILFSGKVRDSALWELKARSMVNGFSYAFVALMKHAPGKLLGSSFGLRKRASLEDLIRLLTLPEMVRMQALAKASGLPVDDLDAYLESLPGWKPKLGEHQEEPALNHHAYNAMQVLHILKAVH